MRRQPVVDFSIPGQTSHLALYKYCLHARARARDLETPSISVFCARLPGLALLSVRLALLFVGPSKSRPKSQRPFSLTRDLFSPGRRWRSLTKQEGHRRRAAAVWRMLMHVSDARC